LASKVTVSGGIRGDYVSNVNEGGHFGDREINNGALAGYGAIAVGPFGNVTLTAQVSRGFRDPTLSDRFFRGPNGRGFITGNPDLEPETSLQGDFGIRYAAGKFTAAAYVYEYRITNLVERYSPATDFFEFRNRGSARIRGFEVEAQADLGHGFTTQIAGQVGRGVLRDDSSRLDDISADQFSVQLRKAVGQQFSAFFRFAVYAEDNSPGPTEIVAPGHTNLDLGATWAFHKNLEVRGTVRNILNDTYYASPDPRFVLAPGVNGFVTVRVRF
jgi:outer membrane receptor for ferrienterochelin and colicins